MNYMQEVEEGVKVFVEKGDLGGLMDCVKEKILQSYKNGLEAGRAEQGRYRGRALQDVRFENTPAFKQHTGLQSGGRAKQLLDGLTRFIEGTEKMAGNPAVRQAIRSWKPQGKRRGKSPRRTHDLRGV